MSPLRANWIRSHEHHTGPQPKQRCIKRPDIRQYLANCHQLGSESALAHLGASTYDPVHATFQKPPLATVPAIRSRKGVERRFEGAENPLVDRLAVGLFGIAERDRDEHRHGPPWPSRTGWMDRERPEGEVGMGVHIPTVAVPYQAPGGQGRSRHRRTLWNGTAVRAAVAQPQRGQRHAEPLPAHMNAVIPCTCTPMSMCTRGTPPTPADRRSRSQAHGGMLLAHADHAGHAFGLGFRGRTMTGGLPLGGARNVVRGSGGCSPGQRLT